MINYLKSILPRIQQHSKMLDDTSTFADIPWAFMDDDGHKVTYIFRRNNELLVSKQGEVVTGKWEYLPVMQSLLIEHEGRKRMYNQGFLNEAIMLLKKDGTDEIFPLGNLQKLPALDIERYIEGFLVPTIEKGQVGNAAPSNEGIQKLTDGRQITILKKSGATTFYDKGNEIRRFENGQVASNTISNGCYRLVDGNEIDITNGKIQMVYKWVEYKTKERIVFEIRHPYEYTFSGNLSHRREGIEKGLICGTQLPENQWIELEDKDGSLIISQGKVLKTYSKLDTYYITVLILALIIIAITSYYSMRN